MLFTEGERRLYEGEIGVVGDDGLRELANWTPCLPSSRSFFTTFSTAWSWPFTPSSSMKNRLARSSCGIGICLYGSSLSPNLSVPSDVELVQR